MVALAALVAGSLTGCSGVGSSQPPATTQRVVSELPAGHRWVEVTSLAVTMAVPSEWVSYRSDDTPENLAVAAKAMGITVDELRRRLPADTLLQVRAPSPDVSHLNATSVEVDRVPEDGELTSQLEAAGARDVAVRSVSTAAGDAVLATYHQQLTGGKIYGAGLFVDVGDSLINLTLSSPDSATVSAEAEVLASSIHRS